MYWPHFSFRPSIIKSEILNIVGKFNDSLPYYEKEYAERYMKKNLKSGFFDLITCKYITDTTNETTNESNNESNNETTKIDQLSKIEFDNYIFYPNLDSVGNDICHLNINTYMLKENADKLENCVAFNSYGYLKYKVNDEKDFIILENKNNTYYDGLYIKKSKI